MSLVNPYIQDQYKKNELETASQEDILLLLYDAAINFLNKAKVALDEKDDAAFHSNIKNCQNIIVEFMNTLDMDIGGKFAATLYELYRYYNKLLTMASISRNLENIDEVLRHLTNLRRTWKQAIDIYKTEKSATLKDSYIHTGDTQDKYIVGDDDDDDNDNDETEYEDEEDFVES